MTASFGLTTLTSAGDFDLMVAKLASADGTPIWAVPLGGPDRDAYPHVAVDSTGDIYLAGTITGAIKVGDNTVGGAGGLDILVAKIRNSDGKVVWATSFGSAGDDAIVGIAISPSGQIVVASNVLGPLEPGGAWFGAQDAAFVSYDNTGRRLWTKVIGTAGTDYGAGIASGRGAFYALINLGGDIGASVEGTPIIGSSKPVGLLLRLQP
jgi:hypothetical protein